MGIDKNRVPIEQYVRLVGLMGEEKTERFLLKCDYDPGAISWKISKLEFGRYVKKKPGQAFLLIAPVLYILGRVIWIFILEPLFF